MLQNEDEEDTKDEEDGTLIRCCIVYTDINNEEEEELVTIVLETGTILQDINIDLLQPVVLPWTHKTQQKRCVIIDSSENTHKVHLEDGAIMSVEKDKVHELKALKCTHKVAIFDDGKPTGDWWRCVIT
eukprot:UN04208